MSRLLALFAALSLIAPVSRPALAQVSAATETGTVDAVTHFTLNANETRTISIALPPGEYVVRADLKLVGQTTSPMQMRIDLLGTGGAVVQNYILAASEPRRADRSADPVRFSKPLRIGNLPGSRLRVKNGGRPMEYWVSVYPVAATTTPATIPPVPNTLPMRFDTGGAKAITLGDSDGEGGTLAKAGQSGSSAVYKATLPAGEYRVALFMKQSDKKNTGLQGTLVLLDKSGAFAAPAWQLEVSEVGSEVRKDKRLVLLQPTEVYFGVANGNPAQDYEYTVSVEPAVN